MTSIVKKIIDDMVEGMGHSENGRKSLKRIMETLYEMGYTDGLQEARDMISKLK